MTESFTRYLFESLKVLTLTLSEENAKIELLFHRPLQLPPEKGLNIGYWTPWSIVIGDTDTQRSPGNIFNLEVQTNIDTWNMLKHDSHITN